MGKGRRKDGIIKPYGASGKGSRGVRQHHKCDETKILPHKRSGIQLDT